MNFDGNDKLTHLDELIKKSKELEAKRTPEGLWYWDSDFRLRHGDGGFMYNEIHRPTVVKYICHTANTHATLVKLVEVYREHLVSIACKDRPEQDTVDYWELTAHSVKDLATVLAEDTRLARHALELGEKIAMGGE